MYKDGLNQHSRIEDEYFYKKDRDLIEKLKESERQKHELLELTAHYHKCAKCGHDMQERQRDELSFLCCNYCSSIHLNMATLDALAHHGRLKAFLNELQEQINNQKESA
ncbi:MAG: hypothetical protein NTX25_01895 [Proteobacteria bacterium]|nr:hypothetical protein [Pseudomonadota bacterium]